MNYILSLMIVLTLSCSSLIDLVFLILKSAISQTSLSWRSVSLFSDSINSSKEMLCSPFSALLMHRSYLVFCGVSMYMRILFLNSLSILTSFLYLMPSIIIIGELTHLMSSLNALTRTSSPTAILRA